MIRKFLKRALSPSMNTNNERIDMATCSSEMASQFITKSLDVQFALQDFVGSRRLEPTFVSLGENCSSAWYLKQIGLKKASYPFDWIFSSPEIIIDCIDDEFEKYLDKSFIEPKGNKVSAGHRFYHSNFFNHRNPLKSKKDYNYYERCCQRFLRNLKSKEPIYYLITLINEPSKRPGWANGFKYDFSMPVNHDCKSIMPLFDKLKHINKNSRFIAIEHYTNNNRDIKAKQIYSDIMTITYNAFGSSTGVFYRDYLDDFCFKLIMTGLHGSHNNGMHSDVNSASLHPRR